ncbi:MAG: hypothetical protein KDB04_06775 [Acidimicrobiales bacterium]|nr:hypothetical protein [Acidimicrobiales bacterium]HRW39063.1 hypothetical protein [Aquihabitans sp.]
MAYRNILLLVHIASAAAWLGANLTQLVLTPWFARRGGEVAGSWFEATGLLAKRYYNLAGLLLGLTGVLLVIELGYAWSSGFVAVGITVIAIGAVLGIGFFAPTGDRLAESARAGGPVDAQRYLQVAALDTVLVLTAILAMVSRWKAGF